MKYITAFCFSIFIAVIAYPHDLNSNRGRDTVIHIVAPQQRIVYQRNNDNTAWIPIKGSGFAPRSKIQAALVPRQNGQGVASGWITAGKSDENGMINGMIKANAGWYDIKIRAVHKGRTSELGVVERVGVGEVFVVVGHSVAQGGTINGEGALDDRVSTVLLDEKLKRFDSLYLTTGDTTYLPEAVFVQAGNGIAHAPFGHGSYFWSQFAEKVVQQQNVPVLIYNAAFGGTSLEHWAKSSQGILFEHGFVRAKIRMPYVNLLNTITKYIPLTGMRALLADQGQNDAGEKDANKIFDNYQIFVKQARADLHFAKLAIVVNQQMPANAPAVREAQQRMIREQYSFPGPDYDHDLTTEDKYDGIHLSASGVEKAAALWAKALTPYFFMHSTPYIPAWK